ncbi:MAG: oxygen-independent coproporphyrinogen-3 oxidase [Alphaproteobacteria bacterium]|jgi:oxygen-independent coproporphyrinogen-3 oxidase
MSYDFSLYIHYPFCLSKCPYCDFNSHINQNIDVTQWASAYKQALSYHKDNFPLNNIKTIFFGGGTPSLMPINLVQEILDYAQNLFGFTLDIEITLEANPTSSEAQKFQDFAKAGINRLSMGIQALNDVDLRKLGRTHSADEAIKAFEIAKKYFNRTSFDLIYARQNQTLDAWKQELTLAASLTIGHISLYQLTIEPDTRFADWYRRGKISLPPDALAEELYFITDDILSTYGYENYEISNYATPGNQCLHNMAYWQYQPYVGIGAGAHGRVPINNTTYMATETHKMPNDWLKNPTELIQQTLITSQEYDLEYVLMSLRTNQGCDLNRLQTDFIQKDRLHNLIQDGLIILDNNHLIATQKGRPLLNALIRDII